MSELEEDIELYFIHLEGRVKELLNLSGIMGLVKQQQPDLAQQIKATYRVAEEKLVLHRVGRATFDDVMNALHEWVWLIFKVWLDFRAVRLKVGQT